MNEQWNAALDQVKDEYLEEAASYRPKRHWIRFVSAAAAVLVLVISWSILRPEPPSIDPTINNVTAPTSGTRPPSHGGSSTNNPISRPTPGPSLGAPTYDPIEPVHLTPFEMFVQFIEDIFDAIEYYLLSATTEPHEPAADPPDNTSQYIKDQPDYSQLRYYCESFEELQSACQSWAESSDTMVPYFADQPMAVLSISFFEKDLGNLPWIWYQASHNSQITIRVATYTKHFDSRVSGASAMKTICSDAPNLHNRDTYEEHYPQIQEVTITTADGEKTALMKYSSDLDRYFLSFTQNGSLVTIAGDESILDVQWLNSFKLVPIDSL